MAAPVVLVHGLGVSHRYFEPLRRLLPAAGSPDLAGSSVAELVDSLAGVTPAGAILVANSLGAQVALELAAREPGRVAALLLIGPTGDPARHHFLPQVARLVSDGLVDPPRLVPLVARDYARWGVPRLVRTARSMLANPVDGRLSAVVAPTLVVRGSRDPICSAAWARRVASGVRHGRLIVIPRAGHATHWSHPGLVAGLVEELQQQLDEG